jgi:hypothetical protein
MRTAFLFALGFALAAPCFAADGGRPALVPYVWNDVTGSRDMPWLGRGGRARWYMRDTTKPWDIMDPRGPKIETHWGASGGSGESPYETANRAVAYLERIGVMKPWPMYPVAEGAGPRRAFPYRITIVCIEPIVAILRFDLSAVIEDPIEFSFGAYPPRLRDNSSDQRLGWPGIANSVMFGTHVSSRGSLLWFSSDAQVPPTPLDLSSGRARIALRDVSFEVERRGEEIEVRR